jgi:subtilisin family serine protease
LAYFSNYGRVSVDFAAPGVMIFSSVPGGWTFPFDGTSMAAPHASGIAALIFSIKPNFSPFEAKDILKKSALAFTQSALIDKLAVPGIVNGREALELALKR